MKGLLLINVGTPADCTLADVQQFIGEMLSDPLVMGKPKWMSNFLAKRIIAPLSASKSLGKYRQIWREENPRISPLYYYMCELAKKLEIKEDIPVEIAMRYGKPTIFEAFERLQKKCASLKEVIIFPLYPHFAQSSTETAVKEIEFVFKQRPYPFRLTFIPPYFNHPAFIHALANRAKPYLEDFDKLIFCYHSLPFNQVRSAQKKGKAFDYLHQINETNHLLCEKLEVDISQTILVFSSHRGKGWLSPFLDVEISKLPKQGCKKIVVIAPGFSVDNMETLYDIDIHARKTFMNAGGETFLYIPALNENDDWVKYLGEIISTATC